MGLFSSKWPFYISGGVLALCFLAGLYLLDEQLGMGNSLKTINDYCVETVQKEEIVDSISMSYSIALIFGVMLGAFTASVFSGNFKIQLIATFSGGITMRAFKTVVYGFIGGFLVILGVQIAGESIYGQLLSAMQMSVGAWIYLGAIALTGGVLAILLEHGGRMNDTEE